jgi:hypothetical protein
MAKVAIDLHRSGNEYNPPSHSADTLLVRKHQEGVAHSSSLLWDTKMRGVLR